MSTKGEDPKSWQIQVRTVGFRETAIAFLRDRLCRQDKKERVDRLIRRLSKYEPQLEIVKLLCRNPVWRQRVVQLNREFELTVDPKVHFIFRSGGNIPNIPALGENRLYFGSGENFYALDSETGAVIWKLISPRETWSKAWLSKDCLYACSAGRLHAISPSDGCELWCFDTRKSLTSPYAHHGKVFVGSEEGTLYAVDANAGNRLWTFNVVKTIFVAPGVWQNKIFVASRDHSLYAIRMDDGECLWHFTAGDKIYAPPYVHDGIVYLTSADHKVYALHAASGRLLWSFTTGGEVHTSPFEKDGMVYVCSRDRHFYVLRAEDGRELWRHKMLGYLSSPTATGGMVYFSAQGRVYGFSVADRKMRWCFPLGFSFATSPVVGYSRIYAGTLEGKLICLKLKTKLEEHGAMQVLKQFVDIESEPHSE